MPVHAQSADATATELSKLLSKFVMATFTCQDFLGGRGDYEAALSDTEATMIRLGFLVHFAKSKRIAAQRP